MTRRNTNAPEPQCDLCTDYGCKYLWLFCIGTIASSLNFILTSGVLLVPSPKPVQAADVRNRGRGFDIHSTEDLLDSDLNSNGGIVSTVL